MDFPDHTSLTLAHCHPKPIEFGTLHKPRDLLRSTQKASARAQIQQNPGKAFTTPNTTTRQSVKYETKLPPKGHFSGQILIKGSKQGNPFPPKNPKPIESDKRGGISRKHRGRDPANRGIHRATGAERAADPRRREHTHSTRPDPPTVRPNAAGSSNSRRLDAVRGSGCMKV